MLGSTVSGVESLSPFPSELESLLTSAIFFKLLFSILSANTIQVTSTSLSDLEFPFSLSKALIKLLELEEDNAVLTNLPPPITTT